ncbi:Neprilysin-2-like protein [Leptotrombidium deliense]|uniref:Neprilysin-2-like protein n=1 Tax=Leptotrombidium deliense TaxID=299467 RepID=A0A443RTV5_9ACAR|nr:Neprilysin-2-like protein [Leptotrombidium deliense]
MEQFSKEQLFFIAYASTWCNDDSKEYLEMQLTDDSHAPGRSRVLVPLMNSDDFAKAYNCPQGSKMNPVITVTHKFLPHISPTCRY